MASFLGLGFCLLHLISATTESVGQDSLREKWAEVSKDAKLYSDFKSTHYFADLAEDHWVLSLKKKTAKTDLGFSKDIRVSGFQARQAFAESPWNLRLWVDAVFNYLKNIHLRPFDGGREILVWGDALLPPLVISLLMVLFLHLWTWAPAICKNIPAWVGSRSPFVLITFATSVILWGSVTGFWIQICLFFLSLTLVYSRERSLIIGALIVVALAMNFSFMGRILVDTMSEFSAEESLDLGRTRLEYAPSSIDSLLPIEKALWADYNGDRQAAKYWLNQSLDSKEKAIVQANFAEGSSTPSVLLLEYETIRKTYGDDPVIIFNLSQLYVRTQQLVQSDDLRSSLSPDFYTSATNKTTLMNRLLLPPTTPEFSDRFRESLLTKLKKSAKEMGFFPRSNFRMLKSIWLLIAPWLFIGLALRFRPSAAGMCVHTGEPTASPDLTYSSLYQTVSIKRDTSHPTLRQRLDLLIRRNNQLQHFQLKRWRWFFPGASSLLLDQSLMPAFLKTLVPVFLLWNILSVPTRTALLEFFHCEAHTAVGGATFSIGFLILFLITYMIFLSQNLARSNS